MIKVQNTFIFSYYFLSFIGSACVDSIESPIFLTMRMWLDCWPSFPITIAFCRYGYEKNYAICAYGWYYCRLFHFSTRLFVHHVFFVELFTLERKKIQTQVGAKLERKLNDSVLDEQGFQIFDILYLFSERKEMHISIFRFIAIGEEWKSLALWSKKNFLTQLLIKFEKKFISENVELFCCLCAVS